MTTTLNLPDDLATAVQRRAAREGRDVAAEVVELVRKGLAASEPEQAEAAPAPPVIAKDPSTGLPVVRGGPNAPISRMTGEQVIELMRRIDEEEDLERFARSLRR